MQLLKIKKVFIYKNILYIFSRKILFDAYNDIKLFVNNLNNELDKNNKIINSNKKEN
jgi:hypothetical protein